MTAAARLGSESDAPTQVDLSKIFKGDPVFGLPEKAKKKPRWLKRRRSGDSQGDGMEVATHAGKDIAAVALSALSSEQNQLAAALAMLGSLAGYACALISARRMLADPDNEFVDGHYAVLECEDGRNRYVGAHVNGPLIDDSVSFWSLIHGAAVKMGFDERNRLLRLSEIDQHINRTCQAANFGLPRMPFGHELPDLPVNFVRHLWPEFQVILNRHTDDPEKWALAFGFAIQEVLAGSSDKISPEDMAKIVMEFAFPMSRIGPDFLNPN